MKKLNFNRKMDPQAWEVDNYIADVQCNSHIINRFWFHLRLILQALHHRRYHHRDRVLSTE